MKWSSSATTDSFSVAIFYSESEPNVWPKFKFLFQSLIEPKSNVWRKIEKNSGQAWLIFNQICWTHSSRKKPPIKNSDCSERGQKVELTQASTRNRKMFDDPKKPKNRKNKALFRKNCPSHILMKIVKNKLSYSFIGKVRCLLKEVNLHVGVWIKLIPSLN